jgi:hypothetical protein
LISNAMSPHQKDQVRHLATCVYMTWRF